MAISERIEKRSPFYDVIKVMKTARGLLTLIAVAAVLPAFGQYVPMNANDKSVDWEPFQSGNFSRIGNRGLEVIDSQSELERYWRRLTGQPPATAPKGVDWFRQKVLAITLGMRQTGGYSIFVQKIEPGRNASTIVRAAERTPLPGQFVSQGQTAPWIMVKVDRHADNFELSVLPIQAMPGTVILAPPGYGNGGGQAPTCPCCQGGRCTCPGCGGNRE